MAHPTLLRPTDTFAVVERPTPIPKVPTVESPLIDAVIETVTTGKALVVALQGRDPKRLVRALILQTKKHQRYGDPLKVHSAPGPSAETLTLWATRKNGHAR